VKLIDHDQDDETRPGADGTRIRAWRSRRLARRLARLGRRNEHCATDDEQRQRKQAAREVFFHSELVAETSQNSPVVWRVKRVGHDNINQKTK
jgi:hypothetical protein